MFSIRAGVKKIFKRLKKFAKIFIEREYKGDGLFSVFLVTHSGRRIALFQYNARHKYKLFFCSKPIKNNKIVFDNYMGKGYGCNCKYVAEELLKRGPEKFDLVWIVSPKDEDNSQIPDAIRKVTYGSNKAKREYATAKVWLSNYHKITYLRKGVFKRDGQFYIQMWHGSLGIKKIESDVASLLKKTGWEKLARENSEMTDYWISNSNFETGVYKRAFWNVKQVLEYGHPRNDILLRNTETIERKIKEFYGIKEKKIVLYAPTFREDYSLDCYNIDFSELETNLGKKFGGAWITMLRLHPRMRKHAERLISPGDKVIDASFYPDIQELLATADCLVTDYSSCIFDFMLTRRPGFIFATDIEKFNTERGFYYPLEDTPFPIATNNAELMENVLSFRQEQYLHDVERFLKEKGCVEDGHASERVADLIISFME